MIRAQKVKKMIESWMKLNNVREFDSNTTHLRILTGLIHSIVLIGYNFYYKRQPEKLITIVSRLNAIWERYKEYPNLSDKEALKRNFWELKAHILILNHYVEFNIGNLDECLNLCEYPPP